VELYTETFGERPSQAAESILLAYELRFRIRPDDIMTPVVIAQVRTLDKMIAMSDSFRRAMEANDLTQARRNQAMLEIVAELQQLRQSPRRGKLWHSRKADHLSPGIENTPVAVNVYHKDFPVLSYLREAFTRKSGAVEQDERIAAARQSLLYLVASALAVAMTAALLAAYVLAR
jgi:hypothetical protein